MNLYIPEIGDEIILIKDWTFALHAESRNETLGLLNNHYIFGYNKWIDSNILPPMREQDFDVKYPSEEEIDKLCPSRSFFFGGYDSECRNKIYREAEQNCPEYVAWVRDNEEHRTKAKEIGIDKFDVTIEAGQKLKIDRIYIRKGISDYSSVTFYATGLGKVLHKNRWSDKAKNKAIRFWAKLSDVNKIEFEKA